MRLAGKRAMITGSGSGIGRATAVLFAREGARVVVNSRSESGAAVVDEIRRDGGEATFVQADVSVEADVRRMMDATVGAYDGIDILFNNAGDPSRAQKPITEVSEDDWDYMMDVHLKGVFLGCKHVLPHMRRAGGGVILNTGSVAGMNGHPGVYVGTATYGTMKAGIINFTRHLAYECGPDGIRVNCISPGAIDVPRNQKMSPETRAKLADLHPLKGIGDPMDVAYAALYLASDEARWISGVNFPVDGGRTAK